MKIFNAAALKAAAALALGLALAACPGPEERANGMNDMPMDGMEGMHEMPMEPGMMQRHARELDEATDGMRAHLNDMRAASPAEREARVDTHVRQVSGFLALMRRQMREMDMGMGMDDEAMGEMMGMSGEEHRRMMEEMQTMRTELETLQVAGGEEVRARMPEHLDRLERLVAMAEGSAEYMRGM